MRVDAAGLLDLVERIHAGATCDSARVRSLEALSDAFGGAAVMNFRQAGAVIEDLGHARWPEESVALCTGRYNDPKQNEMLRLAPVVPLGMPVRGNSAGDGALENSEVYLHAMRPFGLVDSFGALLARTARDVSALSIFGYASAPRFDAEDEELLGRLIPALMSADRVRRLLIEAMETRELLSAALDRVGRPVAVVDERLGLHYANAPAQAVLTDGSALRHGSGRIAAVSPKADERLRAAVGAAVALNDAGSVVALGPGVNGSRANGAGVLRVEPLRASEAGVDRPLALIVGNRSLPVAAARLRALYGLTPKEAEIATLFAGGGGISDAAARLGRSVNTVKTLARAVYAKLGVEGSAQAAARIRDDFDG